MPNANETDNISIFMTIRGSITKHPQPVSIIQFPVPSIRHPVSSIKLPASGIQQSTRCFLIFFNHPLDLPQTLGNRNTLGTDIRAPTQWFTPPGPIAIVDFFKPLIGGGIAGIEDVSESSQQGRRSDIIRIGPGNRAGWSAGSAEDTAQCGFKKFLGFAVLQSLLLRWFLIIDQIGSDGARFFEKGLQIDYQVFDNLKKGQGLNDKIIPGFKISDKHLTGQFNSAVNDHGIGTAYPVGTLIAVG